MRCQSCGREMADDARFCQVCGWSYGQAPVQQIHQASKSKDKHLTVFAVLFLVAVLAGVAVGALLWASAPQTAQFTIVDYEVAPTFSGDFLAVVTVHNSGGPSYLTVVCEVMFDSTCDVFSNSEEIFLARGESKTVQIFIDIPTGYAYDETAHYSVYTK